MYDNDEMTQESCEGNVVTHCPPMGEDKEMPSVGGRVTQWATNDDNIYYAVGRTSSELPPGAYDICESSGQIIFKKFNIDITGLMNLPDTLSNKIIDEIEKFWGRTPLFEQYKITQRRGILIAGPTGCGKTCTSKLACVDVIKRGGVVIPYRRPGLFLHGLSLIRSIQPQTPIVVLLEDLDELVASDGSSSFLNILDGIYSELNRVVFVATTNYAERLERRITNRPSRFDCVIVMEQPIFEARLMYLKNLIGDCDINFDVTKAAHDTDGLSFAHLKELFISVAILDINYNIALNKVRIMADNDLPTGDEMEYGRRRGAMGLSSKARAARR